MRPPEGKGIAMLEGQAQVSLRSYEARETFHVHDWHQLVLPVEGAQAVDFGHTDGTLAVGRGVLVTSGQPHRFRGLGENSFVVLDIPDRGARAQGLPDAVRRRATAMPFFAVDDGLRRLTGYVAHELAGGALDAATAHHITGLFIHALTRRLGAGAIPPAVGRALDLIHAHYDRSLTVPEMAAAARLSVSAFHNRFRAIMGRAPAAYLSAVRLDQAARHPRASELSIAEIALATGFSDQSALTRAIRRCRGTTPARLRQAGRP
jgi:AraC-like DNA-binding protein